MLTANDKINAATDYYLKKGSLTAPTIIIEDFMAGVQWAEDAVIGQTTKWLKQYFTEQVKNFALDGICLGPNHIEAAITKYQNYIKNKESH